MKKKILGFAWFIVPMVAHAMEKNVEQLVWKKLDPAAVAESDADKKKFFQVFKDVFGEVLLIKKDVEPSYSDYMRVSGDAICEGITEFEYDGHKYQIGAPEETCHTHRNTPEYLIIGYLGNMQKVMQAHNSAQLIENFNGKLEQKKTSSDRFVAKIFCKEESLFTLAKGGKQINYRIEN